MYTNEQLRKADKAMGHIPFWTDGPMGIILNTVSLTVRTNPTGHIVCVISIDGMLNNNTAVWGMAIAEYPFSEQPQAAVDAHAFAVRKHLSHRRSTPDKGWEDVCDEEGNPVVARTGGIIIG